MRPAGEVTMAEVDAWEAARGVRLGVSGMGPLGGAVYVASVRPRGSHVAHCRATAPTFSEAVALAMALWDRESLCEGDAS